MNETGRNCEVDECDNIASRAGMCNAHYIRLKRYGRLHTVRRTKGSGTIKNNGYIAIGKGGGLTYEHIILAENALGKKLPAGVEVHHVDGNPANNKNTNLVICQSHKYHALLHKRTMALDACGHADWLNCSYCGKHDYPENLKIYSTSPPRHNNCQVAYNRKSRNTKKEVTEE